ncbi:histone-lysine N-methyltransferase SETMAR-like [Oratosquilla oratoria]|uniref:histone-lysine N-methyltransferase SETMAR-like n=1 Tax=Oratosquilla oratoria TaxID=337810 RepID=UPI003F76BAA2
MEKVGYRSVIKYPFLKHMSPAEIHQDMITTLGEGAPSSATVNRWVTEFKRRRKSVTDEPRSGRPRTSTTDENIDLVLDMVMDDQQILTWVIAAQTGISYFRADHILRNEFEISKATRWVPRFVTHDQMRTRATLSQDNLSLMQQDPESFLARFATMDETWVH